MRSVNLAAELPGRKIAQRLPLIIGIGRVAVNHVAGQQPRT